MHVGYWFPASGPKCVWQRFLRNMRDMLGRVDFATVRAAQAAPPQSVNQPKRDVAHEKDDDSEKRGVGVDNENEIGVVDHLLGVPRAGMRMLWISVWTLSGI